MSCYAICSCAERHSTKSDRDKFDHYNYLSGPQHNTAFMRGKTSVTSIYKHQHQHQKLRAEFESTFHNRYAALATLQEDSETDTYSALAQAALETGESILPPTPRQNRRIPWNDADIQAHREKKRLARNKSDKQKLSHQLSDLYAGKVTKYIDEQCKIVEAAHPAAEYRVDWKAVRKISGNRKPSPPRIIGGSPQERKERWQYPPTQSPPKNSIRHSRSSSTKHLAMTKSQQNSSNPESPLPNYLAS